jgi:hypothetical protein
MMRPNKYMNGGLDQTSQNAYYVDDDAPRLILTISNFWIDDDKSFVAVAAITRSSDNAVWHSDVLDPRLRQETPRFFNDTYVTADDLIFSY